MALLDVNNLGISFGGLRAVDSFDVHIEKGQLYGLIGPNGAGKTTVFNMLTGVYKPTDGTIILDGENITGKKTTHINKAGVARTFQNIRLFKNLSVLDNVKVGLHNDYPYSTLAGILRLPSYRKQEKAMNEKAMELLGTTSENTLFVGDQLFTDVWGAKKAGIVTYLVKPIHPKEEIQIVFKRYLEKIVLYFYQKNMKSGRI